MQINFERTGAVAQALVTDRENLAGSERWRHVEVSGHAIDETAARTMAQEIIELFTTGCQVKWRVPFEYKPTHRLTRAGPVDDWHLFARFAFR